MPASSHVNALFSVLLCFRGKEINMVKGAGFPGISKSNENAKISLILTELNQYLANKVNKGVKTYESIYGHKLKQTDQDFGKYIRLLSK